MHGAREANQTHFDARLPLLVHLPSALRASACVEGTREKRAVASQLSRMPSRAKPDAIEAERMRTSGKRQADESERMAGTTQLVRDQHRTRRQLSENRQREMERVMERERKVSETLPLASEAPRVERHQATAACAMCDTNGSSGNGDFVSASTTGSSRSHGTDVSAARPRFSIDRNESSPLSFRLGFLPPSSK